MGGKFLTVEGAENLETSYVEKLRKILKNQEELLKETLKKIAICTALISGKSPIIIKRYDRCNAKWTSDLQIYKVEIQNSIKVNEISNGVTYGRVKYL